MNTVLDGLTWVTLDELSPTALAAILAYMSDGDFRDETEALIHARTLVYAVEVVPMSELIERVTPNMITDGWDFETWREWYGSVDDDRRVDHGDSVWPVIADDHFGTGIEDGWHRFYSYLTKGLTEVPVVHIRPAD